MRWIVSSDVSLYMALGPFAGKEKRKYYKEDELGPTYVLSGHFLT